MIMNDVERLRAACCIAGIDGEVTDAERAMIDRLAEKAGVGSASLEAMIERACKDKSFCKEQFDVYSSDAEHTIESLWMVAAADGRVGDRESQVLRYFAQKLEISDERYDEIVQRLESKQQGSGSGDAREG